MPVYEYDCRECGTFKAMRPMAEFRGPGACPTCGRCAPRASLSAPSLVGMGSASRTLVASNERSAKVAHPTGCGCCVRRWPIPSALPSNGGRIFSSNGPPGRNGQ
jgi:putative FmdB family regulatory protein